MAGCWESAQGMGSEAQKVCLSAAAWDCVTQELVAPACLDEEWERLGGRGTSHPFLSRGFQCCAHPSPA